jgi:molybdate transport system regulatory protein
MKISARNVFPGTVVSVHSGPVSSEVAIEIAPGVIMVSVITKASAAHLKLKKGVKATAVVKSSSVLVATDD